MSGVKAKLAAKRFNKIGARYRLLGEVASEKSRHRFSHDFDDDRKDHNKADDRDSALMSEDEYLRRVGLEEEGDE